MYSPGTDDMAVLLEVFLHGEYRRACDLLQRPVRTVVDVGSNIGCSIAFLATCFPEARVVGVEPSPTNLAVARRTLKPLIESGRVVLVHGFIGGRARVARIGHRGLGGSAELSLKEAGAGDNATNVPVITMPELMSEHNVHSIDLLKCDIEGSELELFAECGDWISAVRAMAIELHDSLDTQWLTRILEPHGGLKVIEATSKPSATDLVWLARSHLAQ